MSDLPAKQFGSGPLRLVNEPLEIETNRPTADEILSPPPCGPMEPAGSIVTAVPEAVAAGRHILGLVFVIAAALLGAMPAVTWEQGMRWAGPPWTSDAFRWAIAALVATIGVSFLRARPIFVVIYATGFAMAAVAVDFLIEGKASHLAESLFRTGGPITWLTVTSAAFGYLVYTNPRAKAPHLCGILGFLIVIAAAELVVGTQPQYHWFNWPKYAEALGSGAARIVTEWSKWGHEAMWAAVLVMTAIGVSCSRTRPVHLLNALILVGLAYACVKGGYLLPKEFPELSAAGKLIKIDYESYTNVDMWRWIVAAELVCLAVVLLHMSLGLGAICVATALTWMFAGLAIYNSVSTMSVMRTGGAALAMGMDPMENMGLPVTPSQIAVGRSGDATMRAINPSAPSRTGSISNSQDAQVDRFIQKVARPSLVSESTLTGWMVLTAIFAGLIGITGLRMMSENLAARIAASSMLWAVLCVGAFALAWVWPKDPTQSWEEWLVAFKFSRYHVYLIWLIFAGSMAIAGIWALLISPRAATWVHVAAAAVFLGTATSLVGAAVMIAFGGFPKLPVWVYCVIAAGQSALAWALLLHVNPPMHRAGSLTIEQRLRRQPAS